MKKQHSILLAAALGLGLAAPAWADDDKAKAVEAVKAVLKQHDEALNKQDIKALMALYADNDKVVLMGTGPGEFWKGKAAIEDAYNHIIKDFKAGTLEHKCPDVVGSPNEDGDAAWLMASCNMKDTGMDGKAREFSLNVSAVLVEGEASWHLQALHYSNLTGSDAPPPEEKSETAADKATEAASKAVEAVKSASPK